MNMHAQPQRTNAETALLEAYDRRLSVLPGDRAVTVKRDDALELLKTGSADQAHRSLALYRPAPLADHRAAA